MIKRAGRADLPEILALQKLAFLSEAEIYGDYTIPPLTQTLEALEQDFVSQVILKETGNGKITGSVRGFETQPGVCYIGRLIVHPDHQNKGIGKKLMESIEACFPHCSRFVLSTGSKSLKNIRLYKSLGYSITREEIINDALTLVHLEK